MKIHVIERSEKTFKFEIEGAGHTLCALLQKALLQDENVEVAGYDIPHPLVARPIFYLRTSGEKKPEEALMEAIERIKKFNAEFSSAFRRALEESEKT